MKVQSVSLREFRNYEKAEFSFSDGVNIIRGDNGKGKTNLLEGIWLLTGTRSWRAAKKSVLVRWDRDRALLRASVRVRDRECELKLDLPVSGRVVASVNGVKLRRQGDLSDSLRCVLFSPEDLFLVKGPAAGRRGFIDDALCQMRPRYAETLSRYVYLLESKGKLLRDETQRAYAERLLPDFDTQLAQLGAVLISYRARFCAELEKEAAHLHSEISGGKEKLSVCYQTVSTVKDALADGQTVVQALEEHLLSHRRAELESGACLSGVHRDDLLLCIQDREARSFASQGQARSAALALKFAQRALFCRDAGEPPVLLLDDVLSELDGERRAFVSQHALGGQTIITCCDEEHAFSGANVIAL